MICLQLYRNWNWGSFCENLLGFSRNGRVDVLWVNSLKGRDWKFSFCAVFSMAWQNGGAEGLESKGLSRFVIPLLFLQIRLVISIKIVFHAWVNWVFKRSVTLFLLALITIVWTSGQLIPLFSIESFWVSIAMRVLEDRDKNLEISSSNFLMHDADNWFSNTF